MHESMLAYAGKRYLWVALGLIAVAALAYGWYRPVEAPNGGTWLGYTLGSVAALLILWLTAYGIRKRSYRSNLGTLRGWLSAHVYLGTALVAIATLHSGFQFGWNVHTLAYALMCLVVVSGCVGVVLYLRYPAAMSANRGDMNRDQLLGEIADIDQKAVRLAAQLPREFADLIASNRDRTVIGGGAFALLAGGDRSRLVLPDSQTPVTNPEQSAILAWLGDQLSRSTDGTRSQYIQDLLALVSLRKALLVRLRRDLKLQAWLEIWLYVHVPLSFALLAALVTHVLVVFLYW